jgi:hypothetical protein
VNCIWSRRVLVQAGMGRGIRSPERLAYWYFRLNGFMCLENFLVHSERGPDNRTDVDLLATRFAYRRENVEFPMKDDPRIARCPTLVNVVLAEVKRRECALNGPWKNRDDANMERVLRAVGCIDDGELLAAASSLYDRGRWANGLVTLRLFSIGECKDPELLNGLDQQIVWSEVIEFCIGRFKAYDRQKSDVGQWTEDGERLRDLALRNEVGGIRAYFGLRAEGPPPM